MSFTLQKHEQFNQKNFKCHTFNSIQIELYYRNYSKTLIEFKLYQDTESLPCNVQLKKCIRLHNSPSWKPENAREGKLTADFSKKFKSDLL